VHQFLGNGFPADLEDLEKFPATGKNSRSSWIVGLPVRELGVATASRPQSRISEARQTRWLCWPNEIGERDCPYKTAGMPGLLNGRDHACQAPMHNDIAVLAWVIASQGGSCDAPGRIGRAFHPRPSIASIGVSVVTAMSCRMSQRSVKRSEAGPLVRSTSWARG
jgi:hypothetical protein